MKITIAGAIWCKIILKPGLDIWCSNRLHMQWASIQCIIWIIPWFWPWTPVCIPWSTEYILLYDTAPTFACCRLEINEEEKCMRMIALKLLLTKTKLNLFCTHWIIRWHLLSWVTTTGMLIFSNSLRILKILNYIHKHRLHFPHYGKSLEGVFASSEPSRYRRGCWGYGCIQRVWNKTIIIKSSGIKVIKHLAAHIGSAKLDT